MTVAYTLYIYSSCSKQDPVVKEIHIKQEHRQNRNIDKSIADSLLVGRFDSKEVVDKRLLKSANESIFLANDGLKMAVCFFNLSNSLFCKFITFQTVIITQQ